MPNITFGIKVPSMSGAELSAHDQLLNWHHLILLVITNLVPKDPNYDVKCQFELELDKPFLSIILYLSI